MACPPYHKDMISKRLYSSRKGCYIGYHRFLPMGHKWHRNAMAFDGTMERRVRPILFSGDEVFNEV